MPFYTGQTRRETALEELPASYSLFGSTAIEQGRYLSPLESIRRSEELPAAEADEESILIPADEARGRIKERGFDIQVPDDGIREGALEILMDRAYEQRRRDDVWNRRPPGWKGAVYGFGAEMVGAMQDWANIGASFIPIVGPARYSAMLARASSMLGRTAVRARVGAIEGGVGNILIEPFVAQSALHEQTDYGLGDALLNIALGTAIGGGLHVGAGGLLDAAQRGVPWQRARALPDEPLPQLLEQQPPEVRRAALRTAVAQSVDGRNVDVSPVLDGVGPAPSPSHVSRTATARPPVLNEGPEIQALRPVQQGIERDYRLASELDVIDDIERAAAEGATARQTVQRLGPRLDRVDEIAAANQETHFAQKNKEQLVRSVRSKLGIPSQDEKTEFAKWLAEYNLRKTIGPDPFIAATGRATPRYSISRAIARAKESFLPKNKRTADVAAAQQADDELKAVVDDPQMAETTLNEAVEDATVTATALGDAELVSRELADFDDLTNTADEYGRAVRAAANCQIRRAT